MNTRRLDHNNHELRPGVRRQLAEARKALDALARAQEEYLRGPIEVEDDRSFNREPKHRPYMKTFELDALQQAFLHFETTLEAHLDEEESQVYPTLREHRSGGADMEALVAAQRKAHVELLQNGSLVRRELGFVPPVRKPMAALLRHLQDQIQYEETRVFAEVLGNAIEEETPIPNRYRTADDVARTLRRARPNPPEPETPPEPEGFLSGMFKKWIKNR